MALDAHVWKSSQATISSRREEWLCGYAEAVTKFTFWLFLWDLASSLYGLQ